MKKVLVALVAAAALLGAPAAAVAYGGTTPTISGTVAVGNTVGAEWPEGTFEPNEGYVAECDAGCEVIGLSPAVFRAVSDFPGTASADGAVFASVKILSLPATVTVTSESGATASATFAAPSSNGLSVTGSDSSGYLWAGAGVLALGAVISAVVAKRRKHGLSS